LNQNDDRAKADSPAVPPVVPARPFVTTGFLRDVPLLLDEPVPTRIGGYRILRVIGQGGMGTVYEAEQESTRRFVAVKVIHPHLATARYRRRFVEEIRTLGKFEHPGIAHIHDAGSAPDDQGVLRLYFAMELVNGLRVDEQVARHSMGSVAVAQLMASICDAVHHAHQKSVIHCDLKPANILIASDGAPKILDFGIARIMGDEAPEASAISHPDDHAAIIGTLAFASPEQATGDRNRLDVLTDVYGLGAVLYAILAERPPHDIKGCSLAEAARIVHDELPTRVRLLRPRCPEELETIVAKAMAHSPAARYDSAAAMAADLRRFVQGRPIMARPAPWYETSAKWIQRNRVASASLALAGLAVVVGGITVGMLADQRNEAAKSVFEERRDHRVTRSAIQGSQLDTNTWHQRSHVLNEQLRADESPGYPGRVLAIQRWNMKTVAGRREGQLHTLDASGNVIDSLDGFRAWPMWARPRFDLSKRFERSIDMPQQSITLVAVLAGSGPNAARKLVRGLRIPDDHLHMSVLEIDDVSAVVESGGTPSPSAIQLWNQGDFVDVVWDESRGLLWSLSNAGELPYIVPELAAWDSARCPGGSDEPRLLMALDVADIRSRHGVIPPLVGDAAHPAVKPRWAFTTRPPVSMRGVGTKDLTPRTRQTAGDNSAGVLRLQIHAFEPYASSEKRGLGRLFVAFRKTDIELDAIVSVEIDERGEPRGRFRAERIQNQQPDARTLALAEQFDPAEEVLAVDLARTQHSDIATANNWRWLLCAAGEVLEHQGIVGNLGKLSEGAVAPDIAQALERLDTATGLHNSRCPTHGDGSCVCEWFLEHERALALCAAGQWQECVKSARNAIVLHHAQAMLGVQNPADYAILAIAMHALGREAEAEDALATAEAETLDLASQNPPTHPGSVDELRPRVLARARVLIRGR
jgi:serine/threonine protein kinase